MTDAANGFKKHGGFVNVHGQHFANVFALVTHAQGFVVEAPAVADVAGNTHIGQEVHFNFLHALPTAAFTTTVSGIEGKACGCVAAQSGIHCAGEEFANTVPYADV